MSGPFDSACILQKNIFNMIVEVPRWTNAKLEVPHNTLC